MKLQVREFAKFTGVSVRTLHYYDEIGLLKPSSVDPYTGYRYYDEESLLRMQEILFYRELDFSLKSIQGIVSSPSYDKTKALKEQKQLLQLKKERLERLICAIEGAMKGENVMNAFDNSAFEAYRAEAQERWGKTKAYQEYTEKSKHYSKEKQNSLVHDMDAILAEFAVCMNRGAVPAAPEAQSLVKKLQNHISEHYYHCTDEILAGLGQMYVADERFKNNIDRHGNGTAAFISEAIKAYRGK